MAVQQLGTTADLNSDKKPTLLRVRVIDHSKEGRPAVNIRMPISVVKWGMKMARTFSPQMKDVNLDWDEIAGMIQQGEIGKIVDVEDEANQKTVEVWVE